MLTAHGSHDSHAVVLAEGKPNRSPRAGTPYGTVTWADIRAMVDAPAARPKEDAQFVVLSSYAGCDGRTHAVQRERGTFHGLAVDIDKGDHPIEAVLAAVAAVTGGARALTYSSSSSAPDDRKWRVLLPLSASIAGVDYPDTQLALFALLGHHGLSCDESLARCGQPIYLPNVPPKRRGPDGKPVFYQRRHAGGDVLTLTPDHPIVVMRESMRAQRAADAAAAAARAEEYKAQRLAHVAATGDDFDPIRHFNDHHTVAEMLNRYGFVRRDRGNGSHWKSPLSTSGSFSTEDRGDHWVTVSNWAAAHGVGRPTSSGFRWGDAFDLFAFFDHGNDKREAVRAYADEVRPRDDAPVVADQPADPRPTLVGVARSLDDWRDEVAARRAVAVTQPGIHVDRSPTGAGKSHATAVALRGVKSSLTVLPTHAGVREHVEVMRGVGIDAVAYPELSAESCQNYAEATKVQGLGLVVGATVCPTCPFKDGCTYRAGVAAAENADHAVATHERLRRSTTATDGRQAIVIDEMPEDVLAPSLTISAGEVIPVATLARAIRDFFWSKADPDQKSFAGAMLDVVDSINAACQVAESAGVGGTTPVDLRISHDVPDKWQRLLYQSIGKVGVGRRLTPEAMSLITKAAAGELDALDIVTDRTVRGRVVHFVVGRWKTPLPAGAAVIATDATTDPTDLSVAVGQPVDDCTPDGHLAPLHTITQLTDDITIGASTETVVAVVEAFLRRHPEVRRLGIIGHRRHILEMIGDEMLSPDARARLAKWCYFRQGPDRASNDWHETCDHLLILGTPRPNPGAYRRWLVLHGLHDAAARQPAWGARPWRSETTGGGDITVDRCAPRDPDWYRAYVALTVAALWQAIGRGRAIMPGGIPVTVVTSDPTPFPIAPPLDMTTAAVRAVVGIVRGLLNPPVVSELSPIENPYSQKFGNGVTTAAVVAALTAASKTTTKPDGISRRAVEKRLRDALAAGVLTQPRRGWWALPADAGADDPVVDAQPAVDTTGTLKTALLAPPEPYPQTPNVPETDTKEALIVPIPAALRGRGIVITALPPVTKPDITVVIADAAPATGIRVDTAAPPPPAAAPDDVLLLIEERAAILEHDAGHQRDVADRLAREMVLGRDTPPAAVAEPHPVGILPSDVADIHARTHPYVQETLRRFGGTVRRAGPTPASAAHAHTTRRRPGQCQCGHDDQWVQVPIHGGRSVRVDCGHCDRFGWFGVWHGRRLPSPFDDVADASESPKPPTTPLSLSCGPLSSPAAAGHVPTG